MKKQCYRHNYDKCNTPILCLICKMLSHVGWYLIGKATDMSMSTKQREKKWSKKGIWKLLN